MGHQCVHDGIVQGTVQIGKRFNWSSFLDQDRKRRCIAGFLLFYGSIHRYVSDRFAKHFKAIHGSMPEVDQRTFCSPVGHHPCMHFHVFFKKQKCLITDAGCPCRGWSRIFSSTILFYGLNGCTCRKSLEVRFNRAICQVCSDASERYYFSI